MSKYPYIQAYGQIRHATAQYIQHEITRAIRERAPADVWSYDKHGRCWRTMIDLQEKAQKGDRAAADIFRKIKALARANA